MVTNEELSGFRRDRYFARSWALLTQDRGWIKPVLLMAVALLVPVVGFLGVVGYLAEWARLTAWGINAAPKQKGVRVGECLASGWRVFVVMLGWGVCWEIIRRVLENVPLLGGLLSWVCWVVGFFVGGVILVAALRATIYQRLGAGYQLSNIKVMVTHDPAGLARVMGIGLLAYVIMSVVVFVVVLTALVSAFPQLAYLSGIFGSYYSYLSDAEQMGVAFRILGALVGTMGPALLLLLVIGTLWLAVVSAVLFTSVGLWMRQFNVSAWGKSEDPLPAFVSDPRDQQEGAPAPNMPVTPQAAAAEAQPVAPETVPAPQAAPAAASEQAAPAPSAPIPMPPAAPEVVAAAEEQADAAAVEESVEAEASAEPTPDPAAPDASDQQ